MVNSNLRLVVCLAERYQRQGLPLLDLILCFYGEHEMEALAETA